MDKMYDVFLFSNKYIVLKKMIIILYKKKYMYIRIIKYGKILLFMNILFVLLLYVFKICLMCIIKEF